MVVDVCMLYIYVHDDVCSRADRVTPTSSRGGSGEAAVTHRPVEDTRQTAVVEMSEDELRRKTKSIVDEYLHLNDLKVTTFSSLLTMTLCSIDLSFTLAA